MPKKILITHQGETLCISEWGRRIGVSSQTMHNRMYRGWTLEEALSPKHSRPHRYPARTFEHGGVRLSIPEWATRLDVPVARLYFRLRHGWPLEEVLFGRRPEPAFNRTRNSRAVYLEHDGLRLNITQWAARLGLPKMTLHGRLRRGWPLEQALTPHGGLSS